jgi:hypothetical protein
MEEDVCQSSLPTFCGPVFSVHLLPKSLLDANEQKLRVKYQQLTHKGKVAFLFNYEWSILTKSMISKSVRNTKFI